jgi:Acyl-CoA dehydrogenase, C-terminal domain
METDELELLDKSVRHALTEPDTDEALGALGWREVLAAEPRAAVSVVFTALGELDANAACLSDVMLDALGDGPGDGLGDGLDAAASTIALPAFSGWEPPGTVTRGALTLAGLGQLGRAPRTAVVVPARDGDDLVVVTVAPDAITATPVRGLDPALGLSRLDGTAIEADSIRPLDPEVWEASLAAGRRALATELVAAGRTMLRLALEHARDRHQFGRPIAQFQAVRHRLAEAYVALEAADAAVISSWDAPGPLTALLAKSLAGQAGRVATTHCQQVLAGIGFTTDHPLHLYVKRAAVLDGLLGSSFTLPRHLGATLLATRTAPRVLDL